MADSERHSGGELERRPTEHYHFQLFVTNAKERLCGRFRLAPDRVGVEQDDGDYVELKIGLSDKPQVNVAGTDDVLEQVPVRKCVACCLDETTPKTSCRS
ncbi:hypothetical protein NYR97_11525 [Xanthomonas hydrangeae]|uniref:Uncharacterized protein n=1 Tax=Xanthomonas hydrangeae TaxID=2775159 RepID=A0AAU0B4C1_9XANT|nr:hypothetical protein [Xanthomonas hydrangeae]WOB47923.1 hypothetical protein NYR97_11525 [Xanthomonas hydrangeae]